MELNWSRWFRCESSFGLLLVPAQPGVFALAEEIVQPAGPYTRKMLAVFEVEEAGDLSRALSRLFATSSRWRQRLADGRCYLRYAVAANAEERCGARAALKHWMNSERDSALQLFNQPAKPVRVAAENEPATVGERARDRVAKVQEYEKVFPPGF
jgi:acyl-CoA reductase-like NAD-dependent aldehyde dehydrogenase